MHILAVGWIYVVSMMAITEKTVTAGLLTFILYCVLPLGVLLILTRRKNSVTDAPVNPDCEQTPQPCQTSQQDSNKT